MTRLFGRAPFDVLKRVALWLAAGLTMLSGYGLTKLAPYGHPQLLTLTEWDRAIPFLPWTVWFYGTASWAALIAFLQAPDRYASRRLYFSVALAACACWVWFALYPTTYPRFFYPLPDGIDRFTHAEFTELRRADTPSNCFPSQHVALAWALGLTWADFLKRRWAKPLPVLWAIVVTICTLTTKQHYLVDLPGGFVIGVGSWALLRWAVTPETEPFWGRWRRAIGVSREADLRAVAALRQRVEAHQWRLEDIPFPTGPLPPLDPVMERLLNHVVYIEEIAGLNFRVLERAAESDDLRALYRMFADEERRHADGLRRVLALHGGRIERPGLGNALVLDQFDTLDPRLDADAVLVALSNPVFETFLDAGTIPFLRQHPSIRGPAFDALVERIDADEGAHLALNWLVTREMARRYAGLRGLRLLANPNVWRGAAAVPWMSLDVYSVAHRLGFDFATLLPAFGRLWRLHRRYPELASFPLWWVFRLFVVGGAVATVTCVTAARAGVLFIGFWVAFTRVVDRVSWALFGDALVERRGLRGR